MKKYRHFICGLSFNQASAYEKQGHATITRLVTKFRGYGCAKNRMPATKVSVWWHAMIIPFRTP